MEIGIQRQWSTVPWFTLVLWFSVSPDSEKWIKWQGLRPNPVLTPKDRKPRYLRVQSWAPRTGSPSVWGEEKRMFQLMGCFPSFLMGMWCRWRWRSTRSLFLCYLVMLSHWPIPGLLCVNCEWVNTFVKCFSILIEMSGWACFCGLGQSPPDS